MMEETNQNSEATLVSKHQFLIDVNKKMIKLLEEHEKSGYKKSFHELVNKPYNPATGFYYQGFNEILLNRIAAEKNYEKNNWLTFKNIDENECQVMEGKNSYEIRGRTKKIYYDRNRKDITEEVMASWKEDKKPEYYKMSSKELTYPVFNVDDLSVKNVKFDKLEKQGWADPKEVMKKVEVITNDLGVKITYSKDEQFRYDQTENKIYLPPKSKIKTEQQAIDMLLPLIAEASSHTNNLEQKFSNTKDKKSQLSDALANEMIASSVANELGHRKSITSDKELVEGWQQSMKEDPYFFLNSCKKMNKTFEFIMDTSLEEIIEQGKSHQMTADEKKQALENAQMKRKSKSQDRSLAKV